MSANYTYIPRRLDDQWKVGMWDVDVALPFLMSFGLVHMGLGGFKGMLIGVVVGALVGRAASRIKADKHPAFMLHWVYWHLPSIFMRLDATPPSHVRRMIG